MPRPIDARGTYLPALDGIRALAVGAVVAYHLGVGQTPGGLLGVGIFFTLSGFLITGILRATWERRGSFDLRHFWVRRARRLLPAVTLLLVVVLGVTLLTNRAELGVRGAKTLATLFYVSNWTTIHLGVSYFQRFNGPGPLDHLWSLAVEEQFYVFWPLILWGLVTVCRRRWGKVALTTLGLAVVSFVLLWVLAKPGFDNTRPYEGTDTRAGGLLVGAALGMVWRPSKLSATIGARPRLILDGVGVAALLVMALLVVRTDEYSIFIYRGGLLVLSLAMAALIAVTTHPASVLSKVVGAQPFRWIGERSYGIYLWHLPVVVFMPEDVLADSPLRPLVLVAITVALAALSWTLVEDPIRRRGLKGAFQRGREHQAWAGAPARSSSRGGGTALVPNVVALVLIATAGLTAMNVSGASARDIAALSPGDLDNPPLPPPVAALTTTTPATDVNTNNLKMSCTSVFHVGDSTSVGLMSRDYLPNPADRVDAQYKLFGAANARTDILGARSIVEGWNNQPNGEDVVKTQIANGYDGCWVFAMGTNEAANQAVGGNTPMDQRIDLLMKHVGDSPVLWVTVKTLLTKGPYAEVEMQKWDDALVAACSTYPHMRVYDWAAEVQGKWYISDKIHFTTPGYQQRGHRIAEAMAIAFPKGGQSPDGCLIRTPG
ncbi:acyltransferase [Lapillicoccus sp.]|uniref:acyltransferase family protein n=1 Tax=Lapillicoccus sp. TaxID=1909287 RepID=UPI0032632FA3